MNIFIEGLQGSGKSTLLQKLSKKHPAYHVYREGDYCPVELAWCSYMTAEEYAEALERYPALVEEIRRRTVLEGTHHIVEYTRILTDEPGFHRYMEQFELYNGRKPLREFEKIVLERYQNLPSDGQGRLYECAFFQNIMEELILFGQQSDEEIIAFYRELAGNLAEKEFRIFYLYNEDVEESLQQIRRERADDQGNEMWFPLMMEYLKTSPWGQAHGSRDFCDLVDHLEHRQRLEMRAAEEILGDRAVILRAKKYAEEELA